MQWSSVPLRHVCFAYWQISMCQTTLRCKIDLCFSAFSRCWYIGTKLISTIVALALILSMTPQLASDYFKLCKTIVIIAFRIRTLLVPGVKFSLLRTQKLIESAALISMLFSVRPLLR